MTLSTRLRFRPADGFLSLEGFRKGFACVTRLGLAWSGTSEASGSLGIWLVLVGLVLGFPNITY